MNGQGGDADPDPTGAGEATFDPIAAARAIGGVQAQALRAAGDLVERLTQLVDGPSSDSETTEASPEDGARSESARLVDLWAEMLGRVSRGFDGTGNGRRRAVDRFEIDLGAGPVLGALDIEYDHSTSSGRAEVWVTNRSDRPFPPLTVVVGPMLTSSGSAIEVSTRCDPAVVDAMPPRSSRGVCIELSAVREPAAGVYRGVAQIDAVPGAWFVIELRVDAAVRP